MKTERKAKIQRTTKETDIIVEWNLDSTGDSNINTPIAFMNHMLELFAKHGFFNLNIDLKGDIEIDYHHSMEDLGLCMGEALAKAVGDKAGIRRYGHTILPMDEALIMVSLDLSGRPYLVYDVDAPAQYIKDIDVRLFHEFFQSFVVKSGMNLHIKMLAGSEIHHVLEGIFKALAKALDQALSYDSRIDGVLSTKGSL